MGLGQGILGGFWKRWPWSEASRRVCAVAGCEGLPGRERVVLCWVMLWQRRAPPLAEWSRARLRAPVVLPEWSARLWGPALHTQPVPEAEQPTVACACGMERSGPPTRSPSGWLPRGVSP